MSFWSHYNSIYGNQAYGCLQFALLNNVKQQQCTAKKKLETFGKEELDTMAINFIILNVEQTVLKKAHWFMQLINNYNSSF